MRTIRSFPPYELRERQDIYRPHINSSKTFSSLPPSVTFTLSDQSYLSGKDDKIKPNILIPAGLITFGTLTHAWSPLRKLDREVREKRNKIIKRKYRVDDYIQYTPLTAVFAFDLMDHGRAKHSLKERAFVSLTAHAIMGGTVYGIKSVTQRIRPDVSNNKSFPSGHTALAFTGAHLLFHEYRESSPMLCVAGYTIATATGTLRMVNNKHWLSDVLTGAGIGMLSVEAAYLLLPLFSKDSWKNKKRENLVIIPVTDLKRYELGVSYTF